MLTSEFGLAGRFRIFHILRVARQNLFRPHISSIGTATGFLTFFEHRTGTQHADANDGNGDFFHTAKISQIQAADTIRVVNSSGSIVLLFRVH